MASQRGFQELVVLFDSSGSKLDLELPYDKFTSLLAQKAKLGSHAASTVKAAYVQVGAGLAVRGLVFFQFKVNENGCVDPAFNLPLEYMADNAGAGPDLGSGTTTMACRSQCPVPWHAINMWEPAGEGEAHPAMQIQKAVWRNRLGLKPAPVNQSGVVAAMPAREHQPLPAVLELDEAIKGKVGLTQRRAMEGRLTATFGEAGRVNVQQYARQHRQQVNQVTAELRDELHRQQESYLAQIKEYREELRKLKSALRTEQERNRRLQSLLRGDV